MIEENRSKVSELINQLAASEENSRCLQAALDEKNRALEEKVGVEENFQRLKASLEKDVADLKCRLMEKSIELEYKEKRIEEIEKALNECTQSSKTSQQVFGIPNFYCCFFEDNILYSTYFFRFLTGWTRSIGSRRIKAKNKNGNWQT